MTQKFHYWAYTLRKPQIKKTHVPTMFIAALFTIANTWKQLRCPSIDERIKKCSVQFSSVTQSCPTLCDPMDCSRPGLPVHHQLLEPTQTHVHRVGDASQPSHPLSSPSPPAFNLPQHQGLFQWVGSSHQVAKVLEFRFSISPSKEYSGLISFRMDWLDLLSVQETLKSLLQHRSSKASILSYQQKGQSSIHGRG